MRIAEDPERAERLKVREETIAERNRRIAEREAAGRAAEEREAAELAARQAAEAAAREAERQAREEAQARRLAEPDEQGSGRSRRAGGDSRRTPSRSEKEEATLGAANGAQLRENSSEPTLDSAQPPDRARQCFVSVRAILLLGQHGNALLAFLLGSNKTHDGNGVAPLVEAFDYDCSLGCFHGDNVHVLMFVFSYLAQDHAGVFVRVIRTTDANGVTEIRR